MSKFYYPTSHISYNAVILVNSCNTSNKAVTYGDCTIRVFQCAIAKIYIHLIA